MIEGCGPHDSQQHALSDEQQRAISKNDLFAVAMIGGVP